MDFKSFISLLTFPLFISAVFGLNIISKSQWGGRPPAYTTALASNLSYVVIHHTAGAYCATQAACVTQMKNMQHYHMDTLGWADIGYHFLIGGDGQVYEGRGWNNMGAHAANWNAKSIGISLMGNYNTNRPTSGQISAIQNLIALAISRGQIKADYILYGHRQVGSTECPGSHLYAEIKKLPNWKA